MTSSSGSCRKSRNSRAITNSCLETGWRPDRVISSPAAGSMWREGEASPLGFLHFSECFGLGNVFGRRAIRCKPGGREIIAHGASRREWSPRLSSPVQGRKGLPHTFVCLLVHVVFSTKDRAPDLSPELASRLFPYGGTRRGGPLGMRLLRPYTGLPRTAGLVPNGLRRGLLSFALRARRSEARLIEIQLDVLENLIESCYRKERPVGRRADF